MRFLNKINAKISAAVSVYLMGLLPHAVLAQDFKAGDPTGALGGVGDALGGAAGDTPLPTLVGNIINIFIGVLGVIFVVLVVYAGFLYLTAGGEEDKVSKAKKLLSQSIIGIIIILAAYAIANFVVGQLTTAVQ